MENTYKKDLKATFINQIYRIFSGPLMLLIMPLYLTPVEQGYWYAFTSLAALSIFADLGFSNIVLQFTAHEFAFLAFKDNRMLSGDEYHLWKLASFFRFMLKWLIKMISVVFPLIIMGGYLFLSTKEEQQFFWQFPWLIYSFASVLIFTNSILQSFFEGCNSVALLQSMRFKVSVITSIVSISCLLMHFNLYALAVGTAFSAVLGFYLIYKNFFVSMRQLWCLSQNSCYDWRKEFYSLIWRYALSWCSGYFIFQLFTPLAFRYHGAVAAGKVGMSIAMWTAGFGIASGWITAIIPKLNMLVSEKKWSELEMVFRKGMVYSFSTILLGGGAFMLFYHIFGNSLLFFKRIISFRGMFILFLCWVFQLIINNIAVFLRAYKREPLVKLSVFSGFYVSFSSVLCAINLPEDLLFMGFLSSFVYGFPVVIHMYRVQIKDNNSHGGYK